MTPTDKYITVMFPYPSGEGLHIGHWYNYAIVDSYCKLQKYLGHNVYQPFGYDAFGLPAENYARTIGGDPRTITYQNIDNFRKEMARMKTSFTEELITADDSYIKYTQTLFIKLYQKGLAYKAFREQYYCPSCETVLAKEQVYSHIHTNPPGVEYCKRCETKIENKMLEQWFFKITDYKQRLIDDLAKVDYPESTKKQQLHWLENLTDLCVSRQRKWGCPIPLPGETDTLDTFVDSSFYTTMYDRRRPVDIYVGGSEHACMHLIYARFITKFLYDCGDIRFDEPFKQVIHQGMILKDGEKMSKSKGNVIDPRQYDPRELRMYLMFINHYFEGGSWSDQHFSGTQKFNKRVEKWFASSTPDGEEVDITAFREKIVTLFTAWKTNKVVSEWMIFYNTHKTKTLSIKSMEEIKRLYNACF